ncbi:MAG: hypothetical protein HC942_23080 [Microcoleus sp. SU_5_6]|nr:hypothetical protein [Microcoleus sp. SU_5_6]
MLPLKLSHQQRDEDRKCRVLSWGSVWEGRGFACAEDLPYSYSSCREIEYSSYWEKRNYSPDNLPAVGVDWEVEIPVEKLLFFASLGYASPCKIQWERVEHPYETDIDGYYVRRSIIPHGFWCAWKWWEGARDWYYEHRPELFEDDEIWGDRELVWHSPPDSTSAILGGKNRKIGQDLKFYIDEGSGEL